MVTGINHITFAVVDIEKSFSFYKDILGFTPVVKGNTGAYLTAGNTWIALNKDMNVNGMLRPDYSHVAFTCGDSDFHKLKSKLEGCGCIKWSENTSEGDSFYFLDPDGHKLEIHVGDLASRLRSMKIDPWEGLEFYR